MKTFFSDLIPKIARYSEKLDNISKLTDQHWIAIGEMKEARVLYIFRLNGDLLISRDGIVEKAKWEYLGQKTLLLETKTENYLFKQEFNDGNVLALRVDGKDVYAFLVNESRFESELNNLEAVNKFLRAKYFDKALNIPLVKGTENAQTELPENIDYEVIGEKDIFDLAFGNHREFSIKCMNGREFKVFRGKNSGRYFYVSLIEGLFYFDSLEDTIIAYFKYLNRNDPDN